MTRVWILRTETGAAYHDRSGEELTVYATRDEALSAAIAWAVAQRIEARDLPDLRATGSARWIEGAGRDTAVWSVDVIESAVLESRGP